MYSMCVIQCRSHAMMRGDSVAVVMIVSGLHLPMYVLSVYLTATIFVFLLATHGRCT